MNDALYYDYWELNNADHNALEHLTEIIIKQFNYILLININICVSKEMSDSDVLTASAPEWPA